MIAQTPLAHRLADIIPGARLQLTPLPECPAIRLFLLNEDYPQGDLDPEAQQRVMDHPLYWTFCWASGRVLAQHLLAHPEEVAGRRVLDFGCGCGVVAIAAHRAGADRVVACDIDPDALAATRLNAAGNGVELEVATHFDAVVGELDLILVADVLYDRANLAWLDRLAARAGRVLLADSRIRDFDHPRYRALGRRASATLPDLDESAEFRTVTLYESVRG